MTVKKHGVWVTRAEKSPRRMPRRRLSLEYQNICMPDIKRHTRNMSATPFRDAARRLPEAKNRDFSAMQYKSDRARSHGWWRNLVDYGAWSGPGSSRVAPPDPESLPGIAKLLQTTEEHVAVMIAADWYGVQGEDASPAAHRLGPVLERLNSTDLDLVESIARRFVSGT